MVGTVSVSVHHITLDGEDRTLYGRDTASSAQLGLARTTAEFSNLN
jgi:hypothetical protein